MSHASNKTDIKDLTRDRLALWLESKGAKSFRADQILKWIYVHQADTFEIMTNLGKDIRKLLSHHFSIERLEKVRVETSNDGSIASTIRG